MKSWYRIENKASEEATIYVYDEISAWGISANQFVKDLGEVVAKSIKLKINSPGGNVFDGITIYNALREHPATVNVQIDGLAASIASIIAMAGDTIHMAKNAFVMIHQAWAMAIGNATDMAKMADTLEKIDATLVKTYQDRTGQTQRAIRQMMADETWMNADEAKSNGFADSVGDQVDAKNKFDLSKYNRVPHAVLAMNTAENTERDIEQLLRDAGVSRKAALAAVAAIKGEGPRDSEPVDVAAALRNAALEYRIRTH